MTAINEVASLEIDDGVAVLTIDSPPVNALSANVRTGLYEGIQAADANPDAAAIVLVCDGRTFIAGADITEFGGGAPKAAGLDEVQAAMQNAGKPVIAAIHGTALGGGLEVALCAHFRIAVPSAKCGLPEVHLGLLPGAGGTQRLPRIVGVEAALEMMTSGRHVPAAECLERGLVDALVDEGNLRGGAIAFAKQVLEEGRPLRKVDEANEKVEAARGKPEIFEQFRAGIARKTRGFLAPEYNIRCIEAAVNEPFAEGLATEARLFRELVTGPQSAAQRYVFFAEREVWKVPDVPRDTPKIPVERVGIVGAGTMGGGIAMSFANMGLPVTIVERDPKPLERGLGVVRANYERSVKSGRIEQSDLEKRMGLLEGSTDFADLAECDLVVEAVFENMKVKKEIFADLDRLLKPGAILATNTSALDIDEIASATTRPESVIGMHFFSPANVMPLVEVVRADHTSKEVVATCMAITKQMGKFGALVGVCPGFVGNRILFQRQNQANDMLLEGAMPWDVDRVLFDFGFPMGPFAMSDLAGLDVGWSKETSTGESIRDLLCERDRRGQKNGRGYYDYAPDRSSSLSPEVEEIIRDFAAKQGRELRTISDDEILERCLYPMINEGFKILEEGKAIRASDIDLIWIKGYGWPVYHGGPMYHGEQIGHDRLLVRLRELQKVHGDAFAPAPLLERAASEGKNYRKLGY